MHSWHAVRCANPSCSLGVLPRHVVPACILGVLFRCANPSCGLGVLPRHVVPACILGVLSGVQTRRAVPAYCPGMWFRHAFLACCPVCKPVVQSRRIAPACGSGMHSWRAVPVCKPVVRSRRIAPACGSGMHSWRAVRCANPSCGRENGRNALPDWERRFSDKPSPLPSLGEWLFWKVPDGGANEAERLSETRWTAPCRLRMISGSCSGPRRGRRIRLRNRRCSRRIRIRPANLRALRRAPTPPRRRS